MRDWERICYQPRRAASRQGSGDHRNDGAHDRVGERGPLMLAGFAGSVPAAPTPVIGQGWVIVIDGSARGLGGSLDGGCITPTDTGALAPGHSTKPVAKTTAISLAANWFDPRTGREFKRAVMIRDLGLQVVAGRAYVTGIVRFSGIRTGRSSARQRLVPVAQPKLTSGPAVDRAGAKRSRTLVFAITGNGTLLPAFSGAINRIRCPDSASSFPHRRRVRAGSRLGQMQVTMVPGEAVGTAGFVTLFQSASGDGLRRCGSDTCAEVNVTPTGGATAGAERSVSFPLAAGTRVPLVCDPEAVCESHAGHVSLLGGLSLGLGAATSSATALTLSYAGLYNGAPTNGNEKADLAGLLDGTPEPFPRSGLRRDTRMLRPTPWRI